MWPGVRRFRSVVAVEIDDGAELVERKDQVEVVAQRALLLQDLVGPSHLAGGGQ